MGNRILYKLAALGLASSMLLSGSIAAETVEAAETAEAGATEATEAAAEAAPADEYKNAIFEVEADQTPYRGTEILSEDEILAIEEELKPYYAYFECEYTDPSWIDLDHASGETLPPLNYAEHDGDTYYLYYTVEFSYGPGGSFTFDNRYTGAGYRMTAKRTEDGWTFISNVRTLGTVENQIFNPRSNLEEHDLSASDLLLTAGSPVLGTEIVPYTVLFALREDLKQYYGFFKSEYDDPTDVDWYQVFYNGAGICSRPTDEETAHFKEEHGGGGTDASVIRGADLRAFVERTTGTSYADAKRPANYGYDEKYDFYVHSHGDTNGSMQDIEYAERDGDTYYFFSLKSEYVDMDKHPDAKRRQYGDPEKTKEEKYVYVLTAQKTAEGWRIISHKCMGTYAEFGGYPTYYKTMASDPTIKYEITPGLVRGDHVRMGHFEQDDNEENGDEAIVWKVADVQEGYALLLSEFVLASKKFDENEESSTWEHASLRIWLNSDFLQNSFSETEIERIEDGASGAAGEMSAGTADKIFLLSEAEAVELFPADKERIAILTPVALRDALFHDLTEGGEWLLRTTISNDEYALTIDEDGSIHEAGNSMSWASGVRPAMWVRVN